MSFRSPEVRTGFAAESRKTCFFTRGFRNISKKVMKSELKQVAATARPEKREKRVKTHGFRQVLEERARENDEKGSPEARTRGFKNA